ncbi:hypothetical protein [Methanonatronarchaeum sp. AMET-Sl]|uniref:hypothetical protein n=1 Tax=Methanonatronarchaeum sp. AMET-Sl TaxID=3037654 RepID=UPI00244E4DC1|nr:hypothetical protein [Methanonatronarchaeum sp. AMET-Sl]WGI17509.1 hypothetical protein QEN48_00445 [Methanonatronarchaeum sp. AMET-Sl]
MKLIKQISVFLKNKPGELARLFNTIDGEIDVSAFEIAEAGDFGVIRMITPEPNKLEKKLEKNSYTVSIVKVISIDRDEVSGVSNKLGDSEVNIEYAYSACSSGGKDRVIMKVDDPEAGLKALER